jgi:hypothetical protein
LVTGLRADAGVLAFTILLKLRTYGITMEVNQLKRQLKDLGERMYALRGFL